MIPVKAGLRQLVLLHYCSDILQHRTREVLPPRLCPPAIQGDIESTMLQRGDGNILAELMDDGTETGE